MAYDRFNYMRHENQRMVVPQMQYTHRGEYPDDKGHGCYLFVMFPNGDNRNGPEVGQACIMARPYLGDRGRFLGMARKVFSYGREYKESARPDMACVVFSFKSRWDAESFFHSDPNFKQPDFPRCAGHCEAFVVDKHYSPNNESHYNTFMISEIRLQRPYLQYKHDFAAPFACLLQKYDAAPYVVQTPEIQSLRRFYKDPNHLTIIHLFKSPLNLEDCMFDREYEKLKFKHADYAYEFCWVFTIDPSPCN